MFNKDSSRDAELLSSANEGTKREDVVNRYKQVTKPEFRKFCFSYKKYLSNIYDTS